jgi:glycerophosphoryl diester phosphodiesterase
VSERKTGVLITAFNETQLYHTTVPMFDRPLIIAHRGASAYAPENTVMAFLLAFMQGADAAEADVQLTGDGHLVVVHDEDTKRVAGVTLKVSKTSLNKLRSLDVGRVKTRRGQGQRMPLLEEVLNLLPEDKLLYLHLKMSIEGVTPLVKMLKNSGDTIQRVLLMSDDITTLKELRKAMPECRIVFQCERRWTPKTDKWLPEPEMLAAAAMEVEAESLAIDSRSLASEPEISGYLMARGLKLHVGIVNRAPSARRFSELGVSAIETDYPGHLVSSFSKALLV